MTPNRTTRTRVAILGGGMAGLSAAYHLSNTPTLRQRYALTVYETGWRLGGKAASGRNANIYQRIEEHGLHVWPGFYDQAFRLIRDVYGDLDRPVEVPIRDWEQAFVPQDYLVIQERIERNWIAWPFRARRNPGAPGDPRGILAPTRLVIAMLHSLHSMIESLGTTPHAMPGSAEEPLPRAWGTVPQGLQEELETKRVVDLPGLLRRAVRLMDRWAHSADGLSQRSRHALLWMMESLSCCFDGCEAHTIDNDLIRRRVAILTDLAATNVRGMLHDGVLRSGFDSLDEWDYREWLKRHGARARTIESALIRGLYDFVFAERAGHAGTPDLAAGVALRLSLHTAFAYQGAIMYKMCAGMGDIVFAPLYQLLRSRGVQFQFFSRVRRLALSPDGRHVDRIGIERQVHPFNPDYVPLIDVDGLPCWPNAPRLARSAVSSRVRSEIVLRRRRDFDHLILAIPVTALPPLCADLVSHDERWRHMLRNVTATPTLAAQLWMQPALRELGWTDDGPVMTSYAGPMETWADMSQTLDAEKWPAAESPRSVAYLCGALDGESARLSADALCERVAGWLKNNAAHLWPAVATDGKSFDWTLLQAGISNEQGLEQQYLRINADPSEQYVLSTSKSVQYRLAPDDSGFDNLCLAGDWTRTRWNVGCIEAAVDSGRRAAEGIQQGG